jgi:hypothetical protein
VNAVSAAIGKAGRSPQNRDGGTHFTAKSVLYKCAADGEKRSIAISSWTTYGAPEYEDSLRVDR